MAKVIPFPNVHKQASEMVEDILTSRMPDQPPEIRHCLKIEMTKLVKKYFSEPEHALSVVLPRDLNDEQFSMIEQGIRKTIDDHSRHMRNRSNQLFFDLCMSQMAICELRYQLQKQP